MPFIRLQNNVPEVYVEQSRDFQMLCRAYDAILNGVKFDIDTIQYLSNTNRCNTRALGLLQTKVGFFTNVAIDDESLRYILKVFPFLIKNKGNLKSISQAVSVFLKINNLSLPTSISVDNDTHTVIITIKHRFSDTTVLDEILSYIIPAGYLFEYRFEEGVEGTTHIYEEDSFGEVFSSDINTSVVRNNVLSGVFNLTTSEPADWSTNYTDYYTKDSDGVYSRVPESTTAPTWGEDTYYSGTVKFSDVSTPDFADRIIGAVDTLEIASSDSEEAYQANMTVTLTSNDESEGNNG